jgi:type IV pilus assembly protein PilE
MKNKSTGFTLIELMIAVAIVGILAALAYPQYVEYVAKGRRAECRSALLVASQKMEKFYSNNNAYPTTLAAAGISPNSNELDPNPAGTLNAARSCTIVLPLATVIPPLAGGTPASFILQADRVPTGSDKYCTSLTFNQLGTKGGAGPDADRCWR